MMTVPAQETSGILTGLYMCCVILDIVAIILLPGGSRFLFSVKPGSLQIVKFYQIY